MYLVPEPLWPYAARLIEHIFRRYGLRAVCLHSSEKLLHYLGREFPAVLGPATAEHVFGPPSREVAARLCGRYEILGIVPAHEAAVAPATSWGEFVGLRWNDPTTLRLFRDKSALKDHVRRARPDLRLNASRPVHRLEDVLGDPLPARFVLKPNDGLASRDVAFFTADSAPADIARYLDTATGPTFLLEEFLDGDEHCVNGQVDGDGNVLVTQVMDYEHAPTQDFGRVIRAYRHVRRTSPRFAPIVEYATAVVRATGLRRSPFHLELMFDPQRGPCLIEIAARFAGCEIALAADDVHASNLRTLELAAHHYLFDEPLDVTLDWDHYDRVDHMVLFGIAPASAHIYSVEGLAEVEAMPEFRRWDARPHVGQRVERTVNLLTMPYVLHLMGKDRAQIDRAAETVRRLIRWNGQPRLPARLRTTLESTAERNFLRGTWLLKSGLAAARRLAHR